MTADGSQVRSSTFVTIRLPWVIGVGGLLVYLLTLNHWVSFHSLGTTARISGWLWRPELENPLTAALLYPFHFLPETAIPLALNLFTAVCAALTLVLLARSVSLLPHDLAPNQPFQKVQTPTILSTPTAWIPPLLAALLCGLQLSFWEHATSASGEMIDLLVFAYVIRCLLEFRVDQKQSWLSRAACIYGAGMANNWAMIGFFPIFVAAILRAKGYGPFRERPFLMRMIAWGLAGLSLYLLLPTVASLFSHGQVDFWTALKAHLKSQKEILGYFRRPAFRALAVASVLPVLVLSIRWKSHSLQFADDTPLGVFLTKAMVHLVHGLVLVSSLWIALDPTFSPRNLGLGTALLTYYYLSALAFGYCTGYFLLFTTQSPASPPPQRPRGNFVPWSQEIRAPLVVGIASTLVCALPFLLLWRNLDQVRQTNGPSLRQFARTLYANLPQGRSVVLTDNPAEFLLLRAESSAHRRDKAPLLLDALSLTSPYYQALLARQFPSRWPIAAPTNLHQAINPGKILDLIAKFAMREPVVYLHPSFGVLFELFTAQPAGAVHLLAPRNPLGAPASVPASLGSVSTNEQFWQNCWSQDLKRLAEQTKEQRKYPPGITHFLRTSLFLATERNATLAFVGAAYSKRLNDWGVQMKRLGHDSEAESWFRRALDLNPENLTAHINLEYAERCQRGDKTRLDPAAVQNEFSDLFAKHNNWHGIVQANGPVDEPSFLFRSGRLMLSGGNGRQAVGEFTRCAELASDWPAPKLWLAQSHIQLRDFTNALEVTDFFEHAGRPQEGQALARLLECRATALRGLGRTNDAAAGIESFIAQYTNHTEVLSVAADLYEWNAQFEKELALLERLLEREPNRADLLSRKGVAELQLSRFTAAIGTLTSALTLAPKNENTRLCRAVAYLGADQLDAAGADYHELLASGANPRNALFGLGTIAWRRQDTNLAIHYYQQYLSNGVSQARQDVLAAERLKQLRTR